MRTKGWQVGAMARYREAPPVMRVYENAPDSTEFCLHLKRDNDHLEGVALPLLLLVFIVSMPTPRQTPSTFCSRNYEYE